VPDLAAASSVTVSVGGTTVPDDIMGQLATATIESALNLPDSCGLVFRDDAHVVFDKAGASIGADLTVTITVAGSGATDVFSGEITALETELDAGTVFSIIRGYDKSHRLHRGRATKNWMNTTFDSVVSDLADAAKVPTGQIDATPGVADQVSRVNQTAWELMTQLGRRSGYQFAFGDEGLNWSKPEATTSAPPEGQLDGAAPTGTLTAGRNLHRLRVSITAAEQVDSVEVRGWDVANKSAVVSQEDVTSTGMSLGLGPSDVSSPFGSAKLVQTSVPFGAQSETDAAAKALAESVGASFLDVDGVADGDPALRAGKVVALGNAGAPFDGKYVLTTVRHQFDSTGAYTTAFSVSGQRDTSIYGLAQGGDDRHHRIAGVVIGLVADLKDPEKLGRVKVKFPWLDDDYQSPWARVAFPGAGASRGFVALPEVDDEVLVAFEHGDVTRPFVLGGLFNGKDAPPHAADLLDGGRRRVNKRVWQSRAGHYVILDDTDGKEMITIQTADGKYVFTLDQGGRQLIVSADQKISVNGNDITIEAKNSMALKAQQISIDGSQQVDVKGGQATFKGDSTVELSSTGSATIKGATVAIN
jgi:phage protein D